MPEAWCAMLAVTSVVREFCVRCCELGFRELDREQEAKFFFKESR